MPEGDTVVLCKEQYGLSLVQREYLLRPEGGRLLQNDLSPRHSSIKQFFRSVFLPQGYPDSVSRDYAEYQLWDTVQAFASSLSGTLATHALLQGMGVGDETATVLAATFTWILKNGTGMTGSIVFAWMKGNRLDCDAKRWRLFADFLNDFAICLEIFAPLTGSLFRWVVCIAGICKSLVGVAGGATRAALTQHQARRNNMADVAAKDGSQETLVNLTALLCSFVMLPMVSGHFYLTCVVFALLTTLHLVANYRAVKAVRMESLNQARLHLIMDYYLTLGKVPRLGPVNASEPLFWHKSPHWTINLGAPFSSIQSGFDDVRQAFSNISSKYLLQYDRENKNVSIVLSPDALLVDQLKACVQAELIIFILTHSGQAVSSDLSKWIGPDWRLDDQSSVLQKSYTDTQKLFSNLLSALMAEGWRTDLCLLAADEWRVTWDFRGLANRKNV